MKKCFNCLKILKIQDSQHVKKCCNLSIIESKYKQLIFDFSEFDLSEKNIRKKYYLDSYSVVDFKKHFGLTYNMSYFLLDYYNIKRKEKNIIIKEKNTKYVKTCISKYGVTSTNKLFDTIEKKKKTCISRYGVDNVRKHKYFINKAIKTKREKYGKACFIWDNVTDKDKKEQINNLHKKLKMWWFNMDNKEKNNRIELLTYNRKLWYDNLSVTDKYKYLKKRNTYTSKLEKRIANILIKNNIKYKSQHWINRRSYDFKINNIILEINGDYWHCNPLIYESNYIHPHSKLTAEEIWEKDYIKKENAEKYGYKLCYLWEKDINNLDDVELLKIIKKLIK